MRTKRKPAYCLHKPTGQARVRIDGKDHYLGEYRSPESLRRYDELMREWLARNTTERITLDVADLVLKYLDYARGYYRKDGRETSEIHGIQTAFRHLLKLHGKTLASEFSPLKLKQVRDSMIEAGFVRNSVNQHIGRIKRLFRWATENELLTVEVYQSLATVPGLRRGRTKAKESKPVRPVEQGDIDAVLPFVSRQVTAMIQLQLFTGMRPGEVCIMRPCDVTIGIDGAWLYRPASHKTEHHGKERRIYLGPNAQTILKPFLERDQDSYCFSPTESEADRNAEKRANRQSKRTADFTRRV